MVINELRPNSEDRIICVKVGKVKRENLYEMTRRYWRLILTVQEKLHTFLLLLMGLWKKSIILWIENIPKPQNTLEGVSFKELKTNIQHTLEKT